MVLRPRGKGQGGGWLWLVSSRKLGALRKWLGPRGLSFVFWLKPRSFSVCLWKSKEMKLECDQLSLTIKPSPKLALQLLSTELVTGSSQSGVVGRSPCITAASQISVSPSCISAPSTTATHPQTNHIPSPPGAAKKMHNIPCLSILTTQYLNLQY